MQGDSQYDGGLCEPWTNTYDISDMFGAWSVSGGFAEYNFLASEGFTAIWNGGILTLSYNSEVPEPATLAIVGLDLAGLGLARRRRQ